MDQTVTDRVSAPGERKKKVASKSFSQRQNPCWCWMNSLMHNWYIVVFVGIYGAQQNTNMNIFLSLHLREKVIAAQITRTELTHKNKPTCQQHFAIIIFIYMASYFICSNCFVLIIPLPIKIFDTNDCYLYITTTKFYFWLRIWNAILNGWNTIN